MTTLQDTITELAETFAGDLIAKLKTIPLEDLLGTSKGRGVRVRSDATDSPKPARVARKARRGRLPRRSEKEIQKQASEIVTLLKKSPEGLRSEEIQKSLQLDKRELPRPMAFALQSKLIKKTGEKRATTYFAR